MSHYIHSIGKLVDLTREANHQYEQSLHTSYDTEGIVIKLLQFTVFFTTYGIARMICQPWMWQMHFWPVLYLTIAAFILVIAFMVLAAPGIPSFCAVMALPPYVNPVNLKVMVLAAK